MNISSKDRILGNQINQTLNEYNNLSKQLYESKMQFLNMNNLNKYNTNRYNNFNYMRNTPYKSPFNDYDLQNRITNSLYGNKNRNINIKKYTPSHITTSSNNSLNVNLNNANYLLNNNLRPSSIYNNSNNIIQDFKTTLMQTQALTNKIMTKNNFYKNKYSNNVGNFNYNNYNYNIVTDTNNDSNLSYNSSYHSGMTDDVGDTSSLNLDEISDDSNNIEELNDKYKYKYAYKKDNNNKNNINNINKNNNKQKEVTNIKKEEEDKLKLSNQILKKSNQDLRNQNRILEVEITNYKTKEKKLKGNSNIFTHFDENLQSFISSLKKSLKESITKNLQTMDSIFNFQKDNQEILKNNKKLREEHAKLAGKIEGDNRMKAEIQCSNEENEKKISTLTEEKNNLNNDLEKLKIELLNLKNTEKNLKMLTDSNMKRKKDNDELLNKLKSTIQQLDNEKKTTDERTQLNTHKNESIINVLKSYDQKIVELKNSIEKINMDKNNLIEINSNMNIELKTNTNNVNKEAIEKEMKLKTELNDVKL